MSEYLFGRAELQHLLDAFRRHERLQNCDVSPKGIAVVSGAVASHTDPQESAIARFASLRTRSSTDWYRFVMELNGLVLGSHGQLRNKTAIFHEGDPWLRWQAPPENLENRTRDVVALLASHNGGLPNLLATFPALILLHPFPNGNSRTAIWFARALNAVYKLIEPVQMGMFAASVMKHREPVIQATAQMRMSGDIRPYMSIVESAFP